MRPGDDPSHYVPRAIAALERAREAGGAATRPRASRSAACTCGPARTTRRFRSLRRVRSSSSRSIPKAAMLLAAAQEGAGRLDDAIATLEGSRRRATRRSFAATCRLIELYEQQRRWEEAAAAYARAQAAQSEGRPRGPAAPPRCINAGKAAGAARSCRQAGAAQARRRMPGSLYLPRRAQRQRQAGGSCTGAEATARAAARGRTRRSRRGMHVLAQVPAGRGSGLRRGRARAARPARARSAGRERAELARLHVRGRGERLDEAVDLLQRALKLEPGNPSYLDSLGWAYFKQGRLDLADAPLTEAAAQAARATRSSRITSAICASGSSASPTPPPRGSGRSPATARRSTARRIEKKLRDARRGMEAA